MRKARKKHLDYSQGPEGCGRCGLGTRCGDQESRRSVGLADITVQQGRNIKLLTIVNLFLMPMTFVTSVFGMTNMPPDPAPYWPFAITLAAVCVPFFSLIGFLSTNFGYRIWAAKTKMVWHWVKPKRKATAAPLAAAPGPGVMNRTLSTEEGKRKRMGEAQNSSERLRDALKGRA